MIKYVKIWDRFDREVFFDYQKATILRAKQEAESRAKLEKWLYRIAKVERFFNQFLNKTKAR